MQRYVIFNADDFGYSEGVNRGIIDSHERGIVTSASLMVRRPDALMAAQYSRANESLSVGLHFYFGEWVFDEGEWRPSDQIVDLDDAREVGREVTEQVSVFRDLIGRNPTHLDSHQNVHLRGPARAAVMRQGLNMGIPVRQLSSRVRYCGDFYGQTGEGAPLPEAISAEALARLLATVPNGVTEFGCHPGYANGLRSIYASEREREVRTLCDPSLRDRLTTLGITLTSFRMLPSLED